MQLVQDNPDYCFEKERPGSEEFFEAIRAGDRKAVIRCFNENASLRNAVEEAGGLSALHIAAAAGYPRIVYFLIKRGFNVLAKDSKKRLAVDHAKSADRSRETVFGEVVNFGDCIEMLEKKRKEILVSI